MAVGDWPAGAFITLANRRGYLNYLAQGDGHTVDVDYDVNLPSGATVFNGGSPYTPFHFVGDPSAILGTQQQALLKALAAAQGIDVHADQIYHPDGTTSALI